MQASPEIEFRGTFTPPARWNWRRLVPVFLASLAGHAFLLGLTCTFSVSFRQDFSAGAINTRADEFEYVFGPFADRTPVIEEPDDGPTSAANLEELKLILKEQVLDDDDVRINGFRDDETIWHQLGLRLRPNVLTVSFEVHQMRNDGALVGPFTIRNDQRLPGLLVLAVKPGSHAARAGIQVDDVLIRVDSRKVNSMNDLWDNLEGFGRDKVGFTVERSGKEVESRIRIIR